jgi:hypothetical protein
MLAQVQAHAFVIIGYPETHDGLNYGQKNISSNESENPSGNNSNELNPKLGRIAEEETVVSGRVYGFRGEKARRQRSPGSANSVYSYHI